MSNKCFNWPISPTVPLDNITLKLTTVLASVSAERLITLSLIDIRYIKINQSAKYLCIGLDLKVIDQRPCFIITLPSCADADRLQTVEPLLLYIEKTKPFRVY